MHFGKIEPQFLCFIIISGHRLKCVSCRIVAHEGCLRSAAASSPVASRLTEDGTAAASPAAVLQRCRPTFCDSVRTYREQTAIPHHWVNKPRFQIDMRGHSEVRYRRPRLQ